MKKVTIKDIAREAGVSLSAVSLVLNHRPCRISDEKRQLIMQTAKKYNYVPNSIARSMVTRKTQTLGVIIPDIENIFFSSLVKTLEFHCHKQDYLLLIVNSDDNFEKEQELLSILTARQVDGLFLVPSKQAFEHREESVKRLRKIHVPLVFIDRVFDELNCDSVYFDNRVGSYEAVSHLINMGHTRIGCIAAPSYPSGKARMAGYRDAMDEHSLPIAQNFICEGDYRLQQGYDAAAQLLPHTTAVFAGNDMMALGFLKYLDEKGLSVPQDYSIVGYDDVVNAYLINLELTSVRQNVELLGSTASRLMFLGLDGNKTKKQSISLRPELVTRASVSKRSDDE